MREWYHSDCVGIIGYQIEEDAKEFICPTCDSSRGSSTTIADGPQPSASSGDPCVDFRWGDVDGETLYQRMRDTYEIVVHWRQNKFLIPSGKSGKDFVLELARLYQAYADNSSLHSIALTACSVFRCCCCRNPMLKVNLRNIRITCLERHLALWQCGDLAALLRKGKCIQDHLKATICGPRPRNVA